MQGSHTLTWVPLDSLLMTVQLLSKPLRSSRDSCPSSIPAIRIVMHYCPMLYALPCLPVQSKVPHLSRSPLFRVFFLIQVLQLLVVWFLASRLEKLKMSYIFGIDRPRRYKIALVTTTSGKDMMMFYTLIHCHVVCVPSTSLHQDSS